jgi:hypothetical protein
MINFHFWSPSHFIYWFNKDWHFEICDSSWLDWFLRLNIRLPFSITSGTLTPRLSLALFWSWFIVVKSLLILLQLPSCLTHHFMSYIDSFLIFFLWSSCFHRYPLLRSSTWSILSWLWASHNCWTRLTFIIFFFMFGSS